MNIRFALAILLVSLQCPFGPQKVGAKTHFWPVFLKISIHYSDVGEIIWSDPDPFYHKISNLERLESRRDYVCNKKGLFGDS